MASRYGQITVRTVWHVSAAVRWRLLNMAEEPGENAGICAEILRKKMQRMQRFLLRKG